MNRKWKVNCVDFMVRQAVITDVERLASVFDAYRVHFGQQSRRQEAEEFLFQRFEHRESIIFVAEGNGQILAMAQLYPAFSSLTLQRIWILNDFFVVEDVRSRGVGRRLLAAVKEFSLASRAKGIELSVEHTNARAWAFWEREGFLRDEEFRYYIWKASQHR